MQHFTSRLHIQRHLLGMGNCKCKWTLSWNCKKTHISVSSL